MKTNNKNVQNLINNNYEDQIYKLNNNRNIRIIKYTINGNIFYLGTSLLDKINYTYQQIIDFYHLRWSIEEEYKKIKILLNGRYITSNNQNKILSEIYIRLIINLLSQYIENLSKSNNKIVDELKQKINTTNTVNLVCNYLLPELLFNNKKYTKKLVQLINCILNTTNIYKLNRHYPRIAKKPNYK